jgi:hypothetical protein
MNRSTARAMSVSVLLHGALFALLVVRLAHESSSPSRLTIINAEMLFDGVRSASAGPTTASEDEEEPEPSRGGEQPTAEAGPPEPVAEAAPPEPIETPIPTPADEPPAPLAAEQQTPASEAPEPSPPTPEPSVAEAVETAPAEEPRSAATAAEEPGEATASAVPVAPPITAPGTPIPAKQHSMLSKRFAAWTGTLDAEHDERSIAWKDAGQEYTAVLRKVPADGAMGMEHLVVEISTEQNGTRMSTEMRMARLAFSNFAQFVDHWDPSVQIHDDEIGGRFHSNTEINLLTNHDATPVFKGRVTIASREINADGWWRSDREEIFPAGFETGVRRIMLPSRLLPLGDDAHVDDAQVRRFARDARVTFYADGTYGWQYVESADPERREPVDERSQYLIGDEDAVLHVKGTVDGKVLVYTPERIVIEDDLRYARHPRSDGSSDDFVGLVAERSVEVAGPDVTGPGNLEIHASIYARRQFAVRGYRSRPAGTLSIYGSLTAGSLTATEPRFATRIEYDERLASARPPSFPLSDRYELESWNGEWRAEPLLPHPEPALADVPAAEL